MEVFKVKKDVFLKKEDKCQLSKSLNLTIRQVEGWFNRMRSKNVAEGMLNQSELYSVSFSKYNTCMHKLLVTFISFITTHPSVH